MPKVKQVPRRYLKIEQLTLGTICWRQNKIVKITNIMPETNGNGHIRGYSIRYNCYYDQIGASPAERDLIGTYWPYNRLNVQDKSVPVYFHSWLTATRKERAFWRPKLSMELRHDDDDEGN